MFKTILVAIDGSDAAHRALGAAIELAVKHGAQLYIVHVSLHGQTAQELERLAEVEHLVPQVASSTKPSTVASATDSRELLSKAEHQMEVVSKTGDLILQRAKQRASDAGVEHVDIYSTSGDCADEILDAVDETGADLVVMGRRGLGRMRRMLLGSVSNKVVQQVGCAVLLLQ